MAKFLSTQLFLTTDDGCGIRINSHFLSAMLLASGRNTCLVCMLLSFSLKYLKHIQKEKILFLHSYLRANSHTKANIFSISQECLLSEMVQIIQEVTWKLNCLVKVLSYSKQNMLTWYFQKTKFFFQLSIICKTYGSDSIIWNTTRQNIGVKLNPSNSFCDIKKVKD